jgi:hypothetical protein
MLANNLIQYKEDILGFGAESANIQIGTERTGVATTQYEFQISRGVIYPTELQVPPNSNMSVSFTSAGFGTAQINIAATVLPDKSDTSQTVQAAPQKATLKINYDWPISLLTSIVGGIVFGIALRVWSIMRTPFASPTWSVLGMFLAFDATAIAVLVAAYIFLLIPFLTVKYSVNLILIFVLVSLGPRTILESIYVIMRRLSIART